MPDNRPLIVVFTGPESTAKSTLSRQMSEDAGALWVPEYAREYVEKLDRPYNYSDVENIAKYQKKSYENAIKSSQSMVVFDTFLIITKVWFQEVYGEVPGWLKDFMQQVQVDLHLLCYPDIEWISDGIRENEAKRLYLYGRYQEELENYQFNYRIIKGQDKERLRLAKNHINQLQINYNDGQSFFNH